MLVINCQTKDLNKDKINLKRGDDYSVIDHKVMGEKKWGAYKECD